MKEHPRIKMEPLGIEALDLRPAQDDIRARYGPRYHVMKECLRDVAALWGIGPDQCCINDAGVFIPYQEIEVRAGYCRAELDYARSPSGLWAMATGYQTAMSGGGSAPSIWNGFAFLSEEGAKAAGLHRLIELFRGIAAQGGSDAADARKLLAMLEEERTPQLALF